MPLYYIKQTTRNTECCLNIPYTNFYENKNEIETKKIKIIANNIYLFLKDNKNCDINKLKKYIGKKFFNNAINFLLKKNMIIIEENFENTDKDICISLK